MTIHDNVGIGQPWGRGIYLSGYRLKALRNDIRETYGAGILMESGGYWDTHGAQDVEIAGNVLRRVDRSGNHGANILLFAGSDDPRHRMSNVFGSGNDLDCSAGAPVRLWGTNFSDITVSGFCGA